MPFLYEEAILSQYLKHIPEKIILENNTHPEIKLLRLLSGTCDVKFDSPQIEFQQRKNYLNALGFEHTRVSSKTLKDSVHPILLGDFDSYITKAFNSNYSLMNDLLKEYSFFFYHKAKNNHTSAFVHLYRILEFISYSFPLVHASSSKNYYGTYDSLRSYFTKEGGELLFLKRFVKKLFDGDIVYNSTFDITINLPDPVIQDKLFRSFKRILTNDKVTFDNAFHKITIEYSAVIDLVKIIRNRFFHFAIGGQKNLTSSEMVNPDLFFEYINDGFINWISIIYFEVLRTMVDRWK